MVPHQGYPTENLANLSSSFFGDVVYVIIDARRTTDASARGANDEHGSACNLHTARPTWKYMYLIYGMTYMEVQVTYIRHYLHGSTGTLFRA